MEGTYRHFTLDERCTLFRLLGAKLPIKEIAAQLGRHRSTIYREIARNEFREVKQSRGYYPITAEDSARRRRRRQRKRAGSGNPDRGDEWSFCLTAARMAAGRERR